MAGRYTRIYREEYNKIKQAELSTLKKMLLNKEVHQLHKDIIDKYNISRYHKIKQLAGVGYTPDGKPRYSWFRKKLFNLFLAYKKPSFEYELERFLEGPIKNLKESFHQKYLDANESTRNTLYFDYEFIENATQREITELLVKYVAYRDLTDDLIKETSKLLEEIEAEKKLLSVNNFNDLTPFEVYDFWSQLLDNPHSNNDPILDNPQIIDLTNMICSNEDVIYPLEADLKQRSQQLIYFVYLFYSFCKRTVDPGATNKKYISILTKYFKQYKNKKRKITTNNFSTKPTNFEINIRDEYVN